jgi:uncharacterized protein YvpB
VRNKRERSSEFAVKKDLFLNLTRFFNAMAIVSTIFLALVFFVSVVVVLVFVRFNMTLSPFRLNMEINHRAYVMGFSTPTPRFPTPTPLPTNPPPASAHIPNVIGHAQLYTLDCEARSAVDLAGFFGMPIDEKEFLAKMPLSSNPNKGFVGNFDDPVGKLPPESYGIYAGPIADMLKSYGVNAVEQHGMSFDVLKSEISSGRPVMVWVTAHTETGWATTYVTPDGEKIPVSPFEHTVIVTGYDGTYVDIMDGSSVYQRLIPDFKVSWGNLGNMAVTISK